MIKSEIFSTAFSNTGNCDKLIQKFFLFFATGRRHRQGFDRNPGAVPGPDQDAAQDLRGRVRCVGGQSEKVHRRDDPRRAGRQVLHPLSVRQGRGHRGGHRPDSAGPAGAAGPEQRDQGRAGAPDARVWPHL